MILKPGAAMERRVDRSIGRRIIVVGSSGSGKTTIAERLAEHLGASFIELDGLFWEPGWTEAERDVFRERVRQAIEPESWVIAGNYLSQQQDVSWPVADTVVWLDLSLPTVVRRVVSRTWGRWRGGELLFGGTNREDFREHLMLWNPEKSLISYTIKTHRKRRRTFEALMRDPRWPHITFIRLRSVKGIESWLAGVLAQPSPVIHSQESSPLHGVTDS